MDSSDNNGYESEINSLEDGLQNDHNNLFELDTSKEGLQPSNNNELLELDAQDGFLSNNDSEYSETEFELDTLENQFEIDPYCVRCRKDLYTTSNFLCTKCDKKRN
jgi:hypothetical protein